MRRDRPSQNSGIRIILTLGTDRRSEEDFLEILQDYEVTAVMDVRSFPESKIEIFRRGNLEDLLRKEGVAYYHLGLELGGFRRGGYEAYTLTEGFRAGVERIESIAGRFRSVILCAEKFPWKCHRKWIARELARRGWRVSHIIDKGRIWEAGMQPRDGVPR
jgi:uncharacterized protein (DUF488 family)